jgi:hypothetical protein
LPVINALLCVNNPLVPDKFANFFSYVPLSSTEDIEGEIMIDSVSSANNTPVGGTTLTDVTFDTEETAKLKFSHMEESDQLGSILQDTYVPGGASKVGAPTNIDTSEATCETVEVRSNPGDDLFASEITGTLGYTAKFTCEFESIGPATNTPQCDSKGGRCVPSGYTCANNMGQQDCPTNTTCGVNCVPKTQTCTKDVSVGLSTQSKTPLIDDVWSRLVAGPMSVVKRIFPKTNAIGSVGTMMDMPGSTNITYTGTNIGVTQATTDLKIPHLGGISEYFLSGIQTALRPKGFGEPIIFGNGYLPPLGEIDCDQNAPDVSALVPKIITKEDLHQLAIRWEGQEGNHVLECYNDAVRKSLAAGIDPALTLLIWINESGGSNYNISWQDFGINSRNYLGFTAQINGFLNLPMFYKNDPRWSSCFGKGYDTEMFFSIYYTGQCDINDLTPGSQYITLINVAWNWFTSCSFPGFPFKASCY